MDMVIGFGAVPSAEVRDSAGRDAKPSATSESTARMGTLQRCFLLFMTCLPIFDDEIQPDSLRRNMSKNKRAELAFMRTLVDRVNLPQDQRARILSRRAGDQQTTGRAASHRRHLTRSFFVVILVASAADEIRRVIDATSADVSCLLRIGAKRTGPIDHVPCHARCDDSVGSDSFLHPVLQRREHVEGVRTGTTNAMVYAGGHKEPEELGNLLILIVTVRIDIL